MERRSAHLSVTRSGSGLGQLLVLTALVGTPVALFVALRQIPSLDLLFESLTFHLVVVSAIAGCALVVAVLAAIAAGRTRWFSLVMLALGCLCVGMFMLAHGLTTPGILGRPLNMWIARFPVLALTAMAVCLAVAVGPREWAVPRFVEAHLSAALLVPGVILAVVCGAAVLWPAAWIGGHPFPGEAGWPGPSARWPPWSWWPRARSIDDGGACHTTGWSWRC